MTHWFVSRHAGAHDWLAARGLPVDRRIAHLAPEQVAPGDIVIGTLPINLVAAICARGAHYIHLALELPAEARGRELTAAELDRYGAHLISYEVHEKPCQELGTSKGLQP